MLKILRCEIVLLTGFLVLIAVCGCDSRDVWGGSVSGQPVQNLVSKQMLAGSELEIMWQNELPIKKREKLERLVILGSRIYAISSGNYMVALNRDRGSVIFSRYVTEGGFPVIGLDIYKDELFTVAGNRLVEMSTEFGAGLGGKRLGCRAVCPAVRNDSYFYVAGTDKRVHSLRAEDKVQLFEVAADNDSAITSLIADENFVVFATEAGNVVSITQDGPKKLWQFDAEGGIAEPIVRDGESLFFASRDTKVYKINIKNGGFGWKYQTDAMLERGPRVTGKVVYQYIGDKGLIAIERGSGKLLWRLAEGTDLLAESAGRAYVITAGGQIVVMDNKKAKKLCLVDLAGVSRYAVNVADSKIYIADRAGRVACLKPIE